MPACNSGQVIVSPPREKLLSEGPVAYVPARQVSARCPIENTSLVWAKIPPGLAQPPLVLPRGQNGLRRIVIYTEVSCLGRLDKLGPLPWLTDPAQLKSITLPTRAARLFSSTHQLPHGAT